MNYSFEYIDIILLAMIAGFIFLRLRGILGKKTGFEGKMPSQFEKEFKKFNIKKNTTPENFDEDAQKNFLIGAKIAYETVITDFSDSDNKLIESKPLLGKKIYDQFKEALQDAIDRSLVFSDDAEMKVNLSARIITCDLPAAGIAMVTTVATKYEITDRSSGDVIFSEIVSTNGVVEFGFSPIGVVRMQESTNRAFRNNIGSLLWKLEDRNFSLND